MEMTMTKTMMRVPVAAFALAALFLPGGLQAQEPDPAVLDALRVQIEEVSRLQMEEIRRIQESSQAQMAALREALDAERSRIAEAQRALTEAERALAAAQGGGASPTAAQLRERSMQAATSGTVAGAVQRMVVEGYGAQAREWAAGATTPVRLMEVEFNEAFRARNPGAVSFITSAVGDNLAGAKLLTLNPALAAYFEVEQGVLITEVAEGTQAAQSGIRPGDVIVAVADTEVADIEQFGGAIMQLVSRPRAGGYPTLEEALAGLEAGVALRRGIASIPSTLTAPISLRIVREGRFMDITLEP